MIEAPSHSRQRLRPWLIGQLDKGSIPGLEWLPNDNGKMDKTKFRIPWKHGGKHDWTPDQSRVFKEWAVHTGKFRQGVDEEQFAKWKTNLRCALNKAADIQEIQEESQKEAENPFKVYRFLPRKEKSSHPIHKRQYATGEVVSTSQQRDSTCSALPAMVASYSSTESSASRHSIQSHSRRVTSMEQGSMPSNPFSGNGLPSDLDGLNSGSLREVTEGMPSDTTNYLKNESMDYDDDNSHSSDGMLPCHAPGVYPEAPYRGQAVFAEPHIKQERLDAGDSSCAHPGLMFPASENKNPVLMQQQPPNMFEEFLNMTDGGMSHLADQQSRSPFYVPVSTPYVPVSSSYVPVNSPYVPVSSPYVPVSSPESVTRASESSDNSQQGFMNTAPSPAFSDATSPVQNYAVAGQGLGPHSPSPNFLQSSVASPPQGYGTISPAPSPSNVFTPVSQATSPQQAFPTSVMSPQGAPAFTRNADMVNQMAGLDVRDGRSRAMMQQYQSRTQLDVDIGHTCIHTPDECAMMVEVFYKHKKIISQHVTESAGCIIASNPITELQGQILDDVGLHVIKEKVYDQKPGRVEIALPEWEKSGNEKLDHEVDNLLKNAGRGIIIESKKGDIYAKRLCKTSVYFASHFDNEKCMKINRHEDAQELVKIFDFHNTFEPAIDQFEMEARYNGKNEVKHPNPDVYLFIGQNGTPSNAHTRYVVIKITSCKASRVLKTMERNIYSLSAEVSNSDSLDKIDDTLRQEFKNVAT